jgi:hypothetical protein
MPCSHQEIAAMTSFLSFHAAAAARGDGLRPELLAVLERVGTAPHSAFTMRPDGMIQSGPDPASTEVAGKHTNVVLFPQVSAGSGIK